MNNNYKNKDDQKKYVKNKGHVAVVDEQVTGITTPLPSVDPSHSGPMTFVPIPLWGWFVPTVSRLLML